MVLDMIMHPGIDGLETYKRSIQIQPELLTIIASGYAETPKGKGGPEAGCRRIYQKTLFIP